MFAIKLTCWVLILGTLCMGLEENRVDYYWREYTGSIPHDAIAGGFDSNGPIYIGQGFVNKYGIMPGMIFPGEKDVFAPIYGFAKLEPYIKILCSPHKAAFKWLPVTSDTYYSKTSNKYLVRGGIESSLFVGLGRVSVIGKDLVGKILHSNPSSANMRFLNGTIEAAATSFDVLIYETDALDGIDLE